MTPFSHVARAFFVALVVVAYSLVGVATAHGARPTGALGKLQRTPVITPAEHVADGGCPAVVTYVSRGAGENVEFFSVDWPGRTKYYGGVGEELSVLANYLAETVYPPVAGRPQLKTVANVAPPDDDFEGESYYPASLEISTAVVPEIISSLRRGAVAMLDDLNAIRAACPNSRLAILGYSQGAVVTRAALAATAAQPINGRYLVDPPAPGRSIAVVFGDATWSTRPEYRGGTRYVGDTYLPSPFGNKGEEGLASWLYSYARRAFKPADRPLMHPGPTPDRYDLVSFCHGRDPSCQFARQGAQVFGLAGHLDYDTREPVAAAAFIAAQFRDGLRAALPLPVVDVPEGRACLSPRGARLALSVTAGGSPVGSAAPVRTAWQPVGGGFNGAPAVGSGLEATVGPAADATFDVRLSSSTRSHDVLNVTTPSAVSPTGSASLYQVRLCPLR